MTKKILLVLFLCFYVFIPGVAMCDDNQSGWTGNFNMLVGQKFLDEHDWSPIDKHSGLGASLDFRNQDWPVNIAIDILYSWEDKDFNWGAYVEGETLELNLGVRKIWEDAKMQPFIGGGLAIVRAEIKGRNIAMFPIADDDIGFGVWAEGGIKYMVTEQFSLGLNLRYTYAEVTLLHTDVEAGGLHVGALLGYHWQ